MFLEILVLQQPEAYIGQAAKLFNDKESSRNDDMKKFFYELRCARVTRMRYRLARLKIEETTLGTWKILPDCISG